jgi:NADPH-dependent ferric siderophore reductase
MSRAPRRKTLADVMDDAPETAPAAPIAARTAAPAAVEAADEEPATVPLNIYVTAPDRVRLNVLAAQTGLSVQKLVRAGIDRELEARGLAPLTPATSTRVQTRRR